MRETCIWLIPRWVADLLLGEVVLESQAEGQTLP
jgi:hypothetical protein